MTSKADRAAIKLMIAKHERLYSAPVGKRKCRYSLVDDCLDIAAEKQFEGHMCKNCIKHRQNDFYEQRMVKREAAGNPRKSVGRPRKHAIEDEDDNSTKKNKKKASSKKLSSSKTG